MSKPSIEHLKLQVDAFNISEHTSSEDLSNAFKIAKTHQEDYKPTQPEFKLLERFKNALLKQIRSNRKGKSIEQLDAEAEAHNIEVEKAQKLLKSRKQKD